MSRKIILITYFFSRLRRHTSYIGDWSSDVCSSDLDVVQLAKRGALLHDIGKVLTHEHDGTHVELGVERSEERRVERAYISATAVTWTTKRFTTTTRVRQPNTSMSILRHTVMVTPSS